MKKKLLIVTAICIVIIAGLVYININKKGNMTTGKNIVTTFYPVYVATLNITEGVDNIDVFNITQNVTTCLHDYSLSTKQLADISNADMVVINGAGMEPFITNITKSVPNIIMEDSSKGTNVLKATEDGEHKHEEHSGYDENNSHIYLSISNYKVQVENITNALVKLDSLNESKYMKNKEEYIAKIDTLEKEWDELKMTTTGIPVVIYNSAIEYIANMAGLKVVADLNIDHESGISSEEVIEAIEKIKENNIKYILVPIDYDAKAISSITSGLDVTVIKQDLFIYGDESKDAYTNIMKNNLNELKKIVK